MICPTLSVEDGSTIASALQAVDCLSASATASAFDRLFGLHGGLTLALTMGLTIYVALLAIALVTGRLTLGLSSLTPRMMGLGLALTFATSWMAYQNVVWTLLSGGPDQVAGLVMGIKGSASHAFAERLDVLFNAVADAADRAHAAQGDAKGTTPGDMLSYAAMLLLLGTVGVLVTSRIALAALLAVGPVFLVFALFSGTRGLFEGWVKGAVLFALVPLFTVLIGAGAVAMAEPVVSGLSGTEPDMRTATAVFLVASVHCALMVMVLKVATTLVSGWRLVSFGSGRAGGEGAAAHVAAPMVLPAAPGMPMTGPVGGAVPGQAVPRDPRIHAILAAVGPTSAAPGVAGSAPMGAMGSAAPVSVMTMPGQAASGDAGISRAGTLGRALAGARPPASEMSR